jgi:putative methylase
MKQKELEILLQKIPGFKEPKPMLEQYLTPANIAAEIIFTALKYGDIENKIVVDLGCGTGIFSLGAYLCGADKVVGIDVDKECIDQARNYAFENDLNINFIIDEVKNVNIVCDTIIMNPPFGAQKSNLKADRVFIEKGFEIASVIYSLHQTKTVSFIEKMISALNGEISYRKDYVFPIKHTFDFHDKKTKNFDITLLRILTKN